MLWRDRQLGERLGQRGFDGVRAHYSIARSADRLLEVYQGLSSRQAAVEPGELEALHN
jgi:hypothetical protein